MRRPVRVLLVAVFLPVPLLAVLIAAAIKDDDGNRRQARPAATSAAYAPPGAERLDVGDGARGAVVFHARAEDATPRPVVVLVPARDAADPRRYGAWIGHLVRRGAAVIYPTYEREPSRDAVGRLSDLVAGVGVGLAHVRAARGRFVVAGDEVGGALAVDLAASVRAHGVPAPSAVLSVYPARDAPARSAQRGSIAAGTRVHVLVAERAGAAGQRAARQIEAEAAEARVTVELVRDDAVEDDEATRRTDIAARRTFWRPLDALVAATARTTLRPAGP